MTCWGPFFSAELGITPDRLVELSVPQMVDHVRYVRARSEG